MGNGSILISSATPTGSTPQIQITYPVTSLTESTRAIRFKAKQRVGQPSRPRSIIITDTSTGPLNISGVRVSGRDAQDFSINDQCVGTVAPGARCRIWVRFDPSARGPRSALLTVATNAPSQPRTIRLIGIGAPRAKHT